MFNFLLTTLVTSRVLHVAGTALQTVLMTLEVTGYVTWPWLWVLAPLWIPVMLLGAFVIVLLWQASLGK